MHHAYELQLDWEKLGESSFSFDLYASCRATDLLDLETSLICSLSPFYNVALSARAPMFGRSQTEAFKAAHSQRMRSRWSDPDWREKTTASLKKARRRRCRGIVQMSLCGDVIATWETITDIQNETGMRKSNIANNLCGLSQSAHGFRWKYLRPQGSKPTKCQS